MKIYFEEDRQIHSIDVMFHPSERTFEQFCDFRQAESRYIEASQKAREAKPGAAARWQEKAIGHLAAAVRHMVSGALDEIPIEIHGENTARLFGSYTIKPGDELSLWRLYAHIVNTINNYRPGGIPQTFTVKIGRKKYHLAGGAVNIMAGQGYKVGETIEAMEYQRRAESIVQQNKTEVGNIEFNLGVTELAILMREKGVELPAKEAERAAYIEAQKEVFKNATLEDVLNLRFFLGNTFLKTTKRKSTRTFGKRPPASTQSGNGRRSRHRQKRR